MTTIIDNEVETVAPELEPFTDSGPIPVVNGPVVPASTLSGPIPTVPMSTGPVFPKDEPRLDTDAVHTMMLGRWPAQRLRARDRALDPAFHKPEGATMADHRAKTLEQVQMLCDDPEKQAILAFPKRFGGGEAPGAAVVGFEELTNTDPSSQIKSGVQLGLFAAAINQLGTESQKDKWLGDALTLKVPGAFAMTEIGHGSDVASIGTTATYDAEKGDFVLNTPFRAAWKDYLGNAAEHATAAVVFAQLISDGVNYGVHCFYVPIRDPKTMAMLPGIQSEDDGLKGGLRGIDNGRLAFDHVRVPRENLLARYGQVAADGTYTSSIESPGRRFFTQLGALVQGRVSLDGAATVASKIALAIAIRYASERRQFAGANPSEEVVLLDYATHRRRLLPLIAETYAMSFAHDQLLDLFDDVFSGREDTPENREDLETMAAALKGTSTDFALRTLQECRQACGGQGFLTENRFTSLRQDLDIYATFEGDNIVLLQLVAKRLVGDYAKTLGKQVKSPEGVARFVVERAVDTVLHRTPLKKGVQNVSHLVTGGRLDEAVQHELLTDRVAAKVVAAALAMRPAQNASPEKAQEIFLGQQVALIDLAKSQADLIRWQAFTDALGRIEDEGTRRIMRRVRDLFGLSVIERDLAWFLLEGRISAQLGKAVVSRVDELLRSLRPHALDLVNAWGYSAEHLRAPIASGIEHTRQEEARAHYAALRAAGTHPRPEKSVKKK